MLSSLLKKFAKENNDKKTIIKYMIINLSFEKYNTKYNYFFVSGLFNKLCIVDWTTWIVTFSAIDKSTLSSPKILSTLPIIPPEVITSGGVVGKIERVIGDDKVDVSIAENVTVQVVQSTIQSVLNKSDKKK